MAKVLLVDDDRSVIDLLKSALAQHSTIFASDGQSALYQFGAEHPDLVLLDLRLPDIDGVLLISKLRETSKVPIIVLSARYEQVDVVSALHNGADDFIRKPFDIDDLGARIDAVIRRCTRLPIIADGHRYGSFHITRMQLATIDGNTIYMSPLEHKLVETLVAHEGSAVSRSDLARAIYGSTDEDYFHLVDVNVYRARQRLAGYSGAPTIEFVRGHGYRIAQTAEKGPREHGRENSANDPAAAIDLPGGWRR